MGACTGLSFQGEIVNIACPKPPKKICFWGESGTGAASIEGRWGGFLCCCPLLVLPVLLVDQAYEDCVLQTGWPPVEALPTMSDLPSRIVRSLCFP